MRLTVTTAALALAATGALAEEVSYEFEGVQHTGYFAAAESEAPGLVLIFPDWDGIDDYEAGRAEQLTALGYDAFVVDMYGEDTPVGTVEENRAATSELTEDRKKMRRLILAGIDVAEELSAAPNMVVTGYCFGGGVALEMARSEFGNQAAGYTVFHGTLATPEGQGYDGDEVPIQILHGAADESQTLEDLFALTRELEDAGNTYTVEIYSSAPHGFTEPSSDNYQERADHESWEAFTDFLEERIG
ncbi:dienelactone hydrolase family protein [Palleronia sp.]|uniref:dienelactone hydrolase family protein n=1 Tax=Palleronia sp. TaxID=1940284 RepID=UPI0035C87912